MENGDYRYHIILDHIVDPIGKTPDKLDPDLPVP